MARNIVFDGLLTDNEQRAVYVIDFKNAECVALKMAIYAENIDEATRLSKEHAGAGAIIKHIERMTENEYKARY